MKHTKKNGFTIAEMLMSLIILGLLLSALAVAFDASVTNYEANEDISKAVNSARLALLRITTDIRSAQAVDIIGAGGDPDSSQCSMINSSGQDITYKFNPNDNTLYLVTNYDGTDPDYVLCRNISVMTFNRATVPANPTTIRNVRISMTVTGDDGTNVSTINTAAVVRRNL